MRPRGVTPRDTSRPFRAWKGDARGGRGRRGLPRAYASRPFGARVGGTAGPRLRPLDLPRAGLPRGRRTPPVKGERPEDTRPTAPASAQRKCEARQRAAAVGPAATARAASTTITPTPGSGCRRLIREQGSPRVENDSTIASRLLRAVVTADLRPAGLVHAMVDDIPGRRSVRRAARRTKSL
jgi:hypothetical protein